MGAILLVDTEDEPNSPEYEAALAASRRAWNVIPLVHGTKKASVKYAHWHHTRQRRADVAGMRNLFDGGVAVITGAISGIVVIDTDGPEGEQVVREYEAVYGPLPETWTVRTGSARGVHRYYNHPGVRVKTNANPSITLDIKGDGGIAVLPPTLHKSGDRYAVEIDAPIAMLPDDLIEFVEGKAAEAKGRLPRATSVNQESCTLPGNLARRAPVNKRNALNVKSMLAVLPDILADNYDTWLQIGFALHTFDPGRVGLALWKHFSERSPLKAELTEFEKEWANFGRPYDGQKVTIGTLWFMALEHGWTPIPWDWNEDQ